MKKFSSPVIIIFVAAIISIAWFVYHSWSADALAMTNNQRVRQVNDKIRQLEQIAYTVKTMESAVRAYVITGDSGFLYQEDYMETHLRTPLANLAVLYKDNTEDTKQLESLQAEIEKKITFFNYLIQANQESPVMAGAMLQTRKPATNTDAATSLLTNMLQKEHARLNDRLSNQLLNRTPYLFSILISILFVGFLAWGLYQLVKMINKAGETENELRRSEKKYRQLIEGAGATMFTTNRGGFFTYVNNKALDLTGYSAEELMGKQYTMLLDPPQQKELRTFYETQAFEGPDDSTIEFPIRQKNGEKKWVEQQVVLLRHHGVVKQYQCIVKDIHARKMMQMKLESAQKEIDIINFRFQSVLRNSPSVIFIKDVYGKYLLVNERFEEVFGINREHILGRTDKEFPSKLKPEKYAPSDREVVLHERPVEMEDMLEINNETRYFFITKFPLRDHTKRVYGLCGIATDITDRIEHEHALISARKKAEHARKTQERFMANMSHEIRTPLNGIIGISNLLKQTEVKPEQKEYITDIKESANNLLVLVEKILDFSHLNAGKLTLSRIDFNPAHVIRKALNSKREEAENKGLQLALDIDPEMPETVIGDPSRLHDVIVSLMDNSVRFTEQGSIHLAAQISAKDEEKITFSFELRDTGMGIPDHLHEEVFESFSQIHGSDDRKYGGAGLGLALTRSLLKLQQGQISVHNNEGGGTLVRFSVPYHLFAVPQEIPSETGNHHLPPLYGKSILVAEDNILNQKVAQRTLAGAGATVEIAENGVEVLNKLEGNKYDCILMDIQMPTMDGLRATRQIRDQGLGIPIIAMTASALKGDKERCLLAGMNDYIAKPFIPNVLFQKILEVLGERDPEFANFNGLDYEEQSHRPFIDLHYLRGIVDDDPDAMLDLLNTFLERTSGMFDNLQNSAQLENWDDALQHASLLRSSFMIVRIDPLSKIILEIEHNVRNKTYLHTVLPDINLAIKIYLDAQLILKKEMEQIKKN
ncbi:PAS domain S-box protein [Chitinophaga sp. SYP-B3965]|uniref:PAS domain S-box protein n=1 Tax=Chitinophaga sp. SYP-B3965 TaxID=2663120 RepID=UPI001299741F|nr:PAS domain S-box protein [Chitinophaga sp. SYP-B3965]MRG46677.1 PAS domain S-box protein [Chitinophaga sp. SYP-B3965]